MRKKVHAKFDRQSVRKFATVPLFGIAALLASGGAQASGFSLNEMGAASVGNAHAGGAAAAEDLSTIYFNPAGLARMSGTQFMAAGSAIRPSAKFTDGGSRSAAGTAMTGTGGGDAGSWAFVPALYFATDITPQLRFGVGVQSPFGLKTDYDAAWTGRYQALTSEMRTININPSISYKVNDTVAVGAGVSLQYIDVTLSKAIDFGSICVGTFGLGACAGGGFLPQAKDGKVTIKGNDWGYGFNLGALFTPNPSTRFGVAYRSQIKHDLSGDASYDKPAGLNPLLANSATFTNTGVTASVTLPETFSISGYTDINPKWAVMGDISYMRWSRFDELRIRFNNGAADNVTPEQWRDTLRLAVAVNYNYSDALKLRAGIAYDPTPVKDQFRTPRIPDSDRTWLSLGAQYKLTPRDSIDFGYAHLFVKDGGVSQTVTGAGTLIGTYSSNVDIVSVQYNHSF